MREKWWWLVFGALLWLIIFSLARFPPSEKELLLRLAAQSKYELIQIPQNFAREIPFPVSLGLLSMFSWVVPVNLFLFRLPNLVLGLVFLTIFGSLIPVGGVLFFATSLGLVWGIMNDFSLVLSLVLTGLVLKTELDTGDKDKKNILLVFLNLWLSLTSFLGWVFSGVFVVYKLRQKQLKTAGLIILVLVYAFFTGVRGYLVQPGFESGVLFSKNLGEMVDQRVRYETSLNNYQEPVPLTAKRFVYNKAYFFYRQVAQNVVGNFSLERISFPGQGDATVARSLWGSKNLSWMFFWQIPLVIWIIARWRKIDHRTRTLAGIYAAWGVAGLILGNTGGWQENIMGGLVSAMILISWWYSKTSRKFRIGIITLIIVSMVPSFYHFVSHESIWRDNRPGVHLDMAKMAQKYKATQVTTILGRSFLYYGWIKQIPAEIFWRGVQAGMKIEGTKFDHFEKPSDPGVYVGLPGEFVGSKQLDMKNDFNPKELKANWELIDQVPIRDTVSFGNGDYIWVVKVNNRE